MNRLGYSVAGITPAYAGKIGMAMLAEYAQGDHPRIRGENARLPPYKRRKPDHPRIRGENSEQTGQHWVFEGSPPHTRGKFALHKQGIFYRRITPAYAGKMNRVFWKENDHRDHPRIRGENYLLKLRKARAGRITPAYAGKILLTSMPFPRSPDHPRIRGENAA